jgi:hypothetical protein
VKREISQGEKGLYWVLWILLGALFASAVIADGLNAFVGAWGLQMHPARLVNDYTAIAGPGAALVNATVVAAMSLVIIWRSNISLSGPTVAAVLTVLGFGLFGKTVINTVPIIVGVAISARIAGKSFGEYILIALFGTALGPVVTAVIVEAGFTGGGALIIGTAAGIGAGLLLPPAAMSMLRLHQGFSLYNIGLTSGFLALFAASLFRTGGIELFSGGAWNSDPTPLLVYMTPVISLFFLVSSFIVGGRQVVREQKKIYAMSGRLPSDFVSSVSAGAALFNMAVLALAFWLYVVAIGGDLNGPVLGGIFTIVGFASFGKHPRNCWPVVAGIVAAALFFGHPLDSVGPILAVLFGTTLAPLAGEFGVPIGFLAGIVHLVMVMQSGAWHAGMSLYNNGFAGGLTGALFVSVIEWWQTNRKQEPMARSKKA